MAIRGWFAKRVSAAALAAVLAVVAVVAVDPAAAQEGSWGSDVEDFSVQRPVRMKPEAEPDAADFGAALEAAAAAEGRPAASAEPAPEFVPKNEIVITKKPVADSAAGKKNEKTPKTPGKKLGNTMGGRLGLGNLNGLDFLNFGIGVTEFGRIDVGAHIGVGTPKVFLAYSFELNASYEWLYPLSEDGALSWFVGPGVTVGLWHGTTGTEKKFEKSKPPVVVNGDTLGTFKDVKETKGEMCIGVGGRVGLEVDLSIIDPDHSLSFLRSCNIGLDLRPVIYVNNKLAKFPDYVLAMGLSFNYEFGKIKKATGTDGGGKSEVKQ